MEEEKEQLYEHLHKLTPLIESQTQLEELVKTLWSTRKTGLSPAQKSHFQSLLTLPNLSALSPVSTSTTPPPCLYLLRYLQLDKHLQIIIYNGEIYCKRKAR